MDDRNKRSLISEATWATVKKLYVSGANPSDIAEQTGVKMATIAAKASRGKWESGDRDIFSREVRKEVAVPKKLCVTSGLKDVETITAQVFEKRIQGAVCKTLALYDLALVEAERDGYTALETLKAIAPVLTRLAAAGRDAFGAPEGASNSRGNVINIGIQGMPDPPKRADAVEIDAE